jgi:pyrroline-5-carboxylate reductase
VTIHDDNRTAVDGADVVVLAVKPQVMGTVCLGIADLVNSQNLQLISIAAGISLDNFRCWLGPAARVVRCMPNTPALIGAGVTGLYADKGVDNNARARAESILAAAGATVWIDDEALMDAVTAVSGSGPAYFFLLMEHMIAAAERQGLAPAAARTLVLNTALGAARMVCEGAKTRARCAHASPHRAAPLRPRWNSSRRRLWRPGRCRHCACQRTWPRTLKPVRGLK